MTGNEIHERWLPVPGYEGIYEVSDQGRVRSLDKYVNHCFADRRLVKGRVLKPVLENGTGYFRAALYKAEREPRRYRVHTLVLTTFVGPRPDGMVCCHGNGIRTDNRLENLSWDTISANNFDAVKHGNHRQTRKTHCPQGHPYDESNTWVNNLGSRVCLACKRQRGKTRVRRRPADSPPQAVRS